jgi:acyl-coenzyme A synthetase/AMP-(fatty) acid ligase
LFLGDAPRADLIAAVAANGSRLVAIPSTIYGDPPLLDPRALPADSACGGHILLTSGTTGVYKKFMIGSAAEAVRMKALGEVFKARRGHVVFVGPMGLWTAAGYNRPLLTWYTGGCVVLPVSDDLARPIVSESVNVITVTVADLESILDRLPASFLRNDAIRVGLVGSSPSWALVERALERLTRDINVQLGSTEAGTVASTRIVSPDDLRSHEILSSRQVVIVDENDEPVPAGETGNVKIRLRHNDGRAYFEAPDETARFFQGDWFLPGDLGRLDERGRLELLGRTTEVICISGNKISTLPFERALERKPHVRGAAVLSAPNASGREEIYVVLELKHKPSTRLAASIEGMFPSFVKAHVRAIDELPRNKMGKIDRRALRRVLNLSDAEQGG